MKDNSVEQAAFGDVILYQTADGASAIDVFLKGETVWLTLNQMAELFGRDNSVISRHLRNIFQTGELLREATVAKNATVQDEGGRRVTRHIEWYNLDAIISVGYRVNSKRGTQFRIWATTILKEHLVRGYTLNQQRLAEKTARELEQVVALLTKTLEGQGLVNDEGLAVLAVINRYARTWRLLLQYDEERLPLPETRHESGTELRLDEFRQAITSLKEELVRRGEATALFGQERGHGLAGIIGAVQQSFGGQYLYPSLEEKAAHLLYFVVKDHPFSDGNKRIGAFLFILYLRVNCLAVGTSLEERTLVALTLLTAASDPNQKDVLIRLIVNLITTEPG
jgi:prophage maintenance system killer protein